MRNQRSIIGLVIIVAVFIAVVISTSTMSQNVSQEEKLKANNISETPPNLASELADLKAEVKALKIRVDTIEKGRTIVSPLVSKAVPKSAVASASATKISVATPGQIVSLNASSTKYHFWDGCRWYDPASTTTLEDVPETAKPCMLCTKHLTIK